MRSEPPGRCAGGPEGYSPTPLSGGTRREGDFHPLRAVFNELQEELARDADIRAYVDGSVRSIEGPGGAKGAQSGSTRGGSSQRTPPLETPILEGERVGRRLCALLAVQADIPIPKRRKLYGIISRGGSACSYSIERETILHALYNLYTCARTIKRTPHQILRVKLFSDSLSVLEARRCNGPFRERDLQNDGSGEYLQPLKPKVSMSPSASCSPTTNNRRNDLADHTAKYSARPVGEPPWMTDLVRAPRKAVLEADTASPGLRRLTQTYF